MTLEELIEEFRLRETSYQGWDSPSGAEGACHDASSMFARFCAERGTKAGILTLLGPKFKVPPGVSSGHYVAWVKDFERAVDWTGRQYRAAIAFPHVLTLQEVKDEWVEIKPVKYINKEGYDYECAPA